MAEDGGDFGYKDPDVDVDLTTTMTMMMSNKRSIQHDPFSQARRQPLPRW